MWPWNSFAQRKCYTFRNFCATGMVGHCIFIALVVLSTLNLIDRQECSLINICLTRECTYWPKSIWRYSIVTTKQKLQLPHSVTKCRIKGEAAPNDRGACDMCCLVRTVAYLTCDRWVWTNGGITINRGKPKKLRGRSVPAPLRPGQISHERLRSEKQASTYFSFHVSVLKPS